ncbi:TonB-dependent siderophore receptor [Sphingobium cloacae]|uniref:TonB-dependent siderophore receptor n=1 Tax=Sphingobium cloacae TaxID=120107 RepID=UPI00147165DF|nr:TonB-dependent siderophore receptor [Sphingobium cloacae]
MLITSALAGFAPQPVLAQTSSATQRSYAIPAQPLADALAAFGHQSGLDVSASPSVTNGKTSTAVAGDLSSSEALGQLLAGTGLTFRFVSATGVTIEPAPQAAEGSVTLGPVRVQGEGSGRGGGTVRQPADTRGTYTVPVTSSATKLDLAIKDTPQVVNVITRQRIEDQNLTQVADVIAQAPGISVMQQGVPGAGRIQYYSRGFPVTNVMLDGVVTTGAGNRDFDLWSVLDTAIYDRVEFVQGSTGLATGAGDPSASVNFVRKRPTEELLAEAKLHYGSWERIRGEVDLSSPLNGAGTLRGRVVGAYQQGDTWQDRVKSKTGTLYGIVEADPTENLMLTAGLLWTKIRVDDAVPFGMNPAGNLGPGGNPFPIISLGRSFNPATQWTYAEIEMLNPFAKAEWRFAEDWRLNVGYMFSKISQDRMYGGIGQYFYDPTANTASYSYGRVNVDGRIHNVDASITGKFHLFGREHDVVAGFSGYWGTMNNPMYMAIGTGAAPSTIAISGWNNGNQPLPTMGSPELIPGTGIPNPFDDLMNDVGAISQLKEKQYAGYFGARLRPVDHVSLVFGGRLNRWERSGRMWVPDLESVITPPFELKLVPQDLNTYSSKVSGKFTPYAGVVFAATPNITAYVSYAGIERANIDWETGTWFEDFEGNPLPPVRGNTIEIGAKAAVFDGRLNIQLAAYRMKQRNLADTFSEEARQAAIAAGGCPPGPNPLNIAGIGRYCAIPGKGYVSKGIDFSLSGQLTPRVNLSASYSYLHSKRAETGYQSCSGFGASGGGDASTGSYGGGAGFPCPEHTVKLFGTYQATDDLTLGGGAIWKSATKSSYPNGVGGLHPDAIRDQGSYAVVDLMARYRLNRRITISANIYNLFDETYLSSSDGLGGFWGAPRNVMFSLGFRY